MDKPSITDFAHNPEDVHVWTVDRWPGMEESMDPAPVLVHLSGRTLRTRCAEGSGDMVEDFPPETVWKRVLY